MNGLITFVLEQINMSLMTGIVVGVLLLSYPLLKRVFTAQQRAVLWIMGCLGIRFTNLLGTRGTVFRVSLQDLIVPRTGRLLNRTPAFLPGEYNGPGDYNLALPGGALIRVELQDWLMILLVVAWFAGAVALIVHFWRSTHDLLVLGRGGQLLAEDDPMLTGTNLNDFIERDVKVYVAEGMPTSFVYMPPFGCDYEIFLQKELPSEQMELVLLHEARHIRLWHPWWKVLATFTLVLNWWNPLVWLGFKYFCRDLEQACDDSVMKKLSPERRKNYAKTLVELGTGRQLWEAPLTFGECDAALRVKRLVKWKKRHWLVSIPLWFAVVALALFLDGGHMKLQPAEDMLLAWERDKGSVEAFVRDLEGEIAEEFAKVSFVDGNGQSWEAYCEELAQQVHLEEIWEAPEYDRRSILLVKDTAGQWYRVRYVWWAMDSDWIGVMGVKEIETPDFKDCQQLV